MADDFLKRAREAGDNNYYGHFRFVAGAKWARDEMQKEIEWRDSEINEWADDVERLKAELEQAKGEAKAWEEEARLANGLEVSRLKLLAESLTQHLRNLCEIWHEHLHTKFISDGSHFQADIKMNAAVYEARQLLEGEK